MTMRHYWRIRDGNVDYFRGSEDTEATARVSPPHLLANCPNSKNCNRHPWRLKDTARREAYPQECAVAALAAPRRPTFTDIQDRG
jgi:hypothetical protein